MRRLAPDMVFETADLAGRDQPDADAGRRKLAFLILNHLPGPVRIAVAQIMLLRLARRRLQPKWQAMFKGAHAIVIGGGGIFADSDLNFPIKIATALNVAAELGISAAVHAVGVAGNWSSRGKAYFGNALTRRRLIVATVRDERSLRNWNEQLVGFSVVPPAVVADPGLLASRYFARGPRNSDRSVVGLCITSPAALAYHSSEKSSAATEIWYVNLVSELVSQRYYVKLFTTGTPEDIEFAKRVRLLMERDKIDAEFDIPFSSTEAMIAMISGCDLIIAHRLHAVIAAYSFKIPALALSWDEKMIGQCAQMGYSHRLFDTAIVSPIDLVSQVQIAMAEGIDEMIHANLLDNAEQGVRQLVDAIRGARENDDR